MSTYPYPHRWPIMGGMRCKCDCGACPDYGLFVPTDDPGVGGEGCAAALREALGRAEMDRDAARKLATAKGADVGRLTALLGAETERALVLEAERDALRAQIANATRGHDTTIATLTLDAPVELHTRDGVIRVRKIVHAKADPRIADLVAKVRAGAGTPDDFRVICDVAGRVALLEALVAEKDEAIAKIDPSVLSRLRAYTCCEPDSQPPTHADLQALLAELADAARTRALLCTDGTLTAAVEHLGSILHDAGIGLPACARAPTCQSLHLSARIHDLADQRNAARRELAAIDAAITATGHPPGDDYDPLRLVREVLAKVAPAPTIGGPMPEPWPGMGVEWTTPSGARSQFIAYPTQYKGLWYFLAVTEDSFVPDETINENDVTAIYDGRRCIWQRNP